jgi:hypothetical protein
MLKRSHSHPLEIQATWDGRSRGSFVRFRKERSFQPIVLRALERNGKLLASYGAESRSVGTVADATLWGSEQRLEGTPCHSMQIAGEWDRRLC